MAVTIRQVAERSGLSLQTVNQILKGNVESFRPATRERVLQAARELGYRPNTSARAMRSGRFGAVALLLSTHGERSLLSAGLLDGLLEGTGANDLSLHIARLPDETLTNPVRLPKVLRELSVDGLLIKYDAGMPEPMAALIEQSRLPAIWLNSRHEYDCLYPDDYQAARQATEYLLSLGHTRVAYLDWLRAGHYSRDDRLSGYRAAMTEARLPPHDLWPEPDLSDGASIRRTFAWLTAPDRPTALLVYHDQMALTVFHAARVLGLDIPRDLSLMAFADTAVNPLGPEMGAMLLPQRRMGIEAVSLFLERQREPGRRLPPRSCALELYPGGTTAPPNR